MKILAAALLLIASPLLCQSNTAAPVTSFKSLSFLEGTWNATVEGTPGVAASGSYTFVPELGGHILARHSTTSAACKGPVTFDCEHGDLMYIYQDAPTQPLKAVYFDNEGHVIHYDVSTSGPTTAVFLSEASQPGPKFRLIYELKSTLMSGKFQMQMPGQPDWKSYLEWTGNKK